MANICSNIFYCSSENAENINTVEQFMNDTFEWEYYTKSDNTVEGEFCSKWSFPEKEFEHLLSILECDETLYIRILSYELCNEYASFRTYRNQEWIINF